MKSGQSVEQEKGMMMWVGTGALTLGCSEMPEAPQITETVTHGL